MGMTKKNNKKVKHDTTNHSQTESCDNKSSVFSKLVPFDITLFLKNKGEGIKVKTRGGADARIVCTDSIGDKPILALILCSGHEMTCFYGTDGHVESDKEHDFDLFLEVPYTAHQMTNRELSWWLRENPEEHREYSIGSEVYNTYSYKKDREHELCPFNIRIRTNGGEWLEPFIKDE